MRTTRTSTASRSFAVLLAACACAGSALAQTAVPAPVEVAPQAPAPAAPPPAVTLPAPAAAHGAHAGAPGHGGPIQWRCGGIGSDESTAMRAAMKDHPLSLLFARTDGAYLADVQVDIRGESGNAPSQSLRASGPVCLINLPAGRYAVDASIGGQRKTQTVQVGGTPRTLDFRF
ncbi:carboxypeptidase regulatory-like domain-containing protein [Xenophilus sp. Marseille-Q4582]|uniref:carboxypeptidase regulatory-like domain-containing protein n=1 Tax=Xenophilus sp. Marseille-Q4582 TaxID=2866600 RepID=UPI001CE42B44|nr:carboxypeptidase regulatory-like domain-containing protein [Xenophilus sp. Marseille-Q4582]